jgi:hypothetical protein
MRIQKENTKKDEKHKSRTYGCIEAQTLNPSG